MVALKNQQRRAVQILIKHGASVNLYNTPEDMYPIHMAVNNGDADCLELLLTAGGDVNARDGDGQTALYVGADIGILSVMRLLVNAGANPGEISFHWTVVIPKS